MTSGPVLSPLPTQAYPVDILKIDRSFINGIQGYLFSRSVGPDQVELLLQNPSVATDATTRPGDGPAAPAAAA